MRIVLRARAARDLDEIFDWIAERDPRTATRMVHRIHDRMAELGMPGLAHMRRPGREEGTRELPVPPYIIVYEVFEDRDELVILAVLHGAQRRD